jgi:YXWGXW repeat-containing protein
MKTLFRYIIAFTLIFSFYGATDSFATDRGNPRHKHVVRVKPSRPHATINRHARVKSGYVRIDGHWQYNRHHRKYVWVNSRVVKQRRGKIWTSGHWSKVSGGWVYVQGFWA